MSEGPREGGGQECMGSALELSEWEKEGPLLVHQVREGEGCGAVTGWKGEGLYRIA